MTIAMFKTKQKPVRLILPLRKDPESGRVMEVYTTEAGMRRYIGNWLNGSEGAHGATFPGAEALFCFEAQCFPDTPKLHFPSATLLPDDEYQQITVYKFE